MKSTPDTDNKINNPLAGGPLSRDKLSHFLALAKT
jgi:hypothetical protein